METFKKISSAYEVLKDEDQRKKYDQLRDMALNGRSSSSSSSYSAKQSSGGYAHKNSRNNRRSEGPDGFYGGFKSKQEFYDFFSGSKDWKGENDEDFRQSKYSKTQDFYGTHSSSGPRYQNQQQAGSQYQ